MLSYNPMETPLYASEVVDVWKSQYGGQEIAVKVLRVPTSDFEWTNKADCPQLVVYQKVDPCTAILQGGCDMEDSPSPKRAAVVGCLND